MKPRPKSATGNSDGIGFRLDVDPMRALVARAEVLGLSRHELARQFVIERLQEGESKAALQHALLTLHGEIKDLRDDISLTAQTLLVSAGKVEAETAEAWAAENFQVR